MHPLTALSLLPLLLLLPHSTPSPPNNHLTGKSIFLLAGQSNMAGRGGVRNDSATGTALWDGVVPPECRPNPVVRRLAANLTWVAAREPLHADIDTAKVNGVGPGMAFAAALLAAEPGFGVVGLVPCAVGGTMVREWQRGTLLYEQLTRRAQAAARDGGRLRAVLWYQGESDCDDGEDARMYKERLKRFFVDLVADLQSPGLPILQVALASGTEPLREKVREAQLQIGNELPNVHTVDAKGLPLEPGGLHLTSRSQVRLGRMLVDAFFRSIPDPVTVIASSSPRKVSNFVFDIVLRFTIPFLIVVNIL